MNPVVEMMAAHPIRVLLLIEAAVIIIVVVSMKGTPNSFKYDFWANTGLVAAFIIALGFITTGNNPVSPEAERVMALNDWASSTIRRAIPGYGATRAYAPNSVENGVYLAVVDLAPGEAPAAVFALFEAKGSMEWVMRAMRMYGLEEYGMHTVRVDGKLAGVYVSPYTFSAVVLVGLPEEPGKHEYMLSLYQVLPPGYDSLRVRTIYFYGSLDSATAELPPLIYMPNGRARDLDALFPGLTEWSAEIAEREGLSPDYSNLVGWRYGKGGGRSDKINVTLQLIAETGGLAFLKLVCYNFPGVNATHGPLGLAPGETREVNVTVNGEQRPALARIVENDLGVKRTYNAQLVIYMGTFRGSRLRYTVRPSEIFSAQAEYCEARMVVVTPDGVSW